MPTTQSIREYLLSKSPWVDPASTVDTIKIGDGDREVTRAGVCWFAAMDTVRAAHQAGCELLVCHEPTFWAHEASEAFWRDKEPGLSKQRFLEETSMVILRAHDTWDQWPEIGIRDSWAAFLGLTDRIYVSQTHNYHAIYEVPRQTLRTFAQCVAERIRPLGEDSVQVMGNPECVIHRPALGVGCIGPDADIVAAGADVLVLCYDGAPYWSVRERLYELGAAVVTVEHGTSEMPGLENLCRHLESVFPMIDFHYFANHPRTWTVTSSAG
jgi:putative NIF3 family GTP cyclohydrolase 1 type 2